MISLLGKELLRVVRDQLPLNTLLSLSSAKAFNFLRKYSKKQLNKEVFSQKPLKRLMKKKRARIRSRSQR
jgi:hypothetical protein